MCHSQILFFFIFDLAIFYLCRAIMVQDCLDFAKKWDACQFNANFIHQPQKPLHPTAASWPFEATPLDVVWPITPKASIAHVYILPVTDYFSKWAEAVMLPEVKGWKCGQLHKNQNNLSIWWTQCITTENFKPFFNKLMSNLCQKFKFKRYKSSMYNANANGLTEAFNNTLCNLLKKVVSKSKRNLQHNQNDTRNYELST